MKSPSVRIYPRCAEGSPVLIPHPWAPSALPCREPAVTKPCDLCRANAEIAQVRGKAQQEQAAYQASLRKEQLKVDALERTLEQKVNQESALPRAKLCLRIVLQLTGPGDSSTPQILRQNPRVHQLDPGLI